MKKEATGIEVTEISEPVELDKESEKIYNIGTAVMIVAGLGATAFGFLEQNEAAMLIGGLIATRGIVQEYGIQKEKVKK